MRLVIYSAVFLGLGCLLYCCQRGPEPVSVAAEATGERPSLLEKSPYRSPVDVVLTPDDQWLVTANQTSHTLSVLRLSDGQVTDEAACGKRPTALAITPDGKQVLVVCSYSGEVITFELAAGRLTRRSSLAVGFEPYGIALSPDGKTAYVSQSMGGAVAVVDVAAGSIKHTLEVGPWPRHLAVSPDGSRLAVGVNGDRTVAVVDIQAGKVLFNEDFGGINAGQMQVSKDNQKVYFPWMVYRHNPIDRFNIQRGWVLGSRIGRVNLQKSELREAITLDVPGEAVADPHGLALTSDESKLVCSAAGSQELLVYQLSALRFQSIGGPGDHIESDLRRSDRFWRLPLSGRPMGLRLSSDDRRVYVANYLTNEVQEIDLQLRKVTRNLQLGDVVAWDKTRQGEAVFYDGKRSLDQWYSCHTCHWEGGTNAVTMDTRNDGSDHTFKTVLPLLHVADTAPWTWHGWQKDLSAAMHKSLTDTMLGPQPSNADVQSMISFLQALPSAPNPHRQSDGSLSAAAQRGQALFQSSRAGCATCHTGPHFTDGQIHDVGLGSSKDRFQGYNTPSLNGLYRRVKFLHHGFSKSLQETLTEYHKPHELGEGPELKAEELSDLIEYLKSL